MVRSRGTGGIFEGHLASPVSNASSTTISDAKYVSRQLLHAEWLPQGNSTG